MTDAPGPLAGLRALNLIDGLGAYGPKLIAGLGADVIRVEPPQGSPMRLRSPRLTAGARDQSLYFAHYNAGQKSIVLDLDTATGKDRLRSLLDEVEVVFDNGHLGECGFDYAALAEKTPALVVVTVSPFGRASARSHWQAGDLVCQSMSGMISYYGYRNERPARFGPEQASEMAGLAAALGALIALYGARRDGKGEQIDIAAERAAALVTLQMSNASLYHQFGFKRARWERGTPEGAGNVYRARDGYLQMASFRNPPGLIAFLERFHAGAEIRELGSLSEVEFGRDERVQEVLERFIAARDVMEVVTAAQSQGVTCVPINDIEGLVRDPFLRQRGFLAAVELPDGASFEDAGMAMRFSATPYRPGGRVPALGADTAGVPAAGQPRRPAVARETAVERPLEGLRILDCGWIIAGPLPSRFLADFGAEVIKIESPSRPDRARGNRVPLFGELPGDANSNADTGGYFQDVNAGKLSCSLNLASAEGRGLLRRLVAASDAIITNLGGGDQLDRWGIGYEEARKLNPGIIVLTLPTMESRGPRSRWHSVGDSFAAASGLKSVSGWPQDFGVPFGHHYPDFSANPFHAAIALMAALLHRRGGGEGQAIEVSQYESTAALLGAAVLEYTANGVVRQPQGNRDPDAAPHNIYRCAGEDSWCAISVLAAEHWAALAAVPGLEALNREEWDSLAARQAHEEEIDQIIEAWTQGWDRHELASFLQGRGVPAGPYQDIADMVERDPVLGDSYFVRRDHAIGREFLVHGSPIQARRRPAEVKIGPLLGEHTAYVLESILGLSADEIAHYAASGALD